MAAVDNEKVAPANANAPPPNQVEDNQGADANLANEDVQENRMDLSITDDIPGKKEFVFWVCSAPTHFIWFKFFERYAYWGLMNMYSLYCKNELDFDEDDSVSIYHAILLGNAFFPTLGGFLADQYLGRFNGCALAFIPYAIGHTLNWISTFPDTPKRTFSLFGMALLSVGFSCQSCLVSLGGDQFILPFQARLQRFFFRLLYLATNVGATIGIYITPIFRRDVSCFGKDTCYPLAFGNIACFFYFAAITLILGKARYIKRAPTANIYFDVFKAIFRAMIKQWNAGKNEKTEHFMDQVKDEFDDKLVEDIKVFLRVIKLYSAFPFYFAVYTQFNSRWTFQAANMNGAVSENWTIVPEQLSVLNPILIVILIPLTDKLVYPALEKVGLLTTPLQKMSLGILCVIASFIVAGILEISVMKTYAVIPAATEAHVNLMNTLPCAVDIQGFSKESVKIDARTNLVLRQLEAVEFNVLVEASSCQGSVPKKSNSTVIRTIAGNVTEALIFLNEQGEIQVAQLDYSGEPKKDELVKPILRFVVLTQTSRKYTVKIKPKYRDEESLQVTAQVSSDEMLSRYGIAESAYTTLEHGTYEIDLPNGLKSTMSLAMGGVRDIYISEEDSDIISFFLTPDSSVSILWMFPQYLILTTGELLFSVTALEFSYTQAPMTMKAMLQASQAFFEALGHVIVLVIVQGNIFDDQASEFFLFAGLLFIIFFVFVFLASRFEYLEYEETPEDEFYLQKYYGKGKDDTDLQAE